MPDQDLIDYIREHKNKYGLDQLKKGLLQQGVPIEEIKEALDIIDQEEEEKIANFLNEEPELKEGNTIIIRDYLDKGKNYQKKAGKAISDLSSTLGVKEKDKTLYFDIIKYGAISFVFFNMSFIISKI